jgi:hypothetical protein
MKGTEVIQAALQGAGGMVDMYLADLSDADILVRPVPAANHIAWQLGHLIAGEQYLLKEALPSAKYPELPAGFMEKHSKETAKSDTGFLTKKQYLDLFKAMRETSIAAVGKLSDADLDKPTSGPMAKFAPKVGNLLFLAANHTTMHTGQFTVVRRKLGKPILM